jgi:hypothetical protein
MSWFGADPGGVRKRKSCFGVALLRDDGSFETNNTDCAYNAMNWWLERSGKPNAIGID